MISVEIPRVESNDETQQRKKQRKLVLRGDTSMKVTTSFNPENQWLIQMMHVLFGAILALFSGANCSLFVLWESNLTSKRCCRIRPHQLRFSLFVDASRDPPTSHLDVSIDWPSIAPRPM